MTARDERERLSVLAAAEASPLSPAVVSRENIVSYRALAALVREAMARMDRGPDAREGLAVMEAEPTLSFLVRLHACIELGIPVFPLHPRLLPSARERLLETIRRREGASLRSALAIIATSGTSGHPKAAILSRRALVLAATASAAHLDLRDHDRWLLCLPPAHVGGLSIPLRMVLSKGAVVLGDAGSFDPHAVGETMAAARVTLVSLVPTMLAKLLEAGWRPGPSLRAVLLGGAGASPALLERAREHGVPVLTTYGLTETCGQVTTQRLGSSPDSYEGAGVPLPGMEVRIVSGEIQVRSRALFSGYVGAEEEDIRLTEDGFFRTGDLGSFDAEGQLYVHGRADDRILTGGENVDPLEVERELERLPGVRAACVFGVPDETWGQVVAAALVVGPEAARGYALGRLLEGRLPSHQRPRLVAFVDTLDTTPSGKLDRKTVALRTTALLTAFGSEATSGP